MTKKAPEGFKQVRSLNIVGWIQAEEGVEVTGKIVNWMALKQNNKVQFKLIIEIDHELEVVIAGGELIIAKPGDLVALSMNQKLQYLLEYVEHQSKVWLYCNGKVLIKRGPHAGQKAHDWDSAIGTDSKRGKIPPPANEAFKFEYDPDKIPTSEVVDEHDDLGDEIPEWS